MKINNNIVITFLSLLIFDLPAIRNIYEKKPDAIHIQNNIIEKIGLM